MSSLGPLQEALFSVEEVQTIALSLAAALPPDCPLLKVQAAAIMLYLGTLPVELVTKDMEINAEFISQASAMLAHLALALYGPDTHTRPS